MKLHLREKKERKKKERKKEKERRKNNNKIFAYQQCHYPKMVERLKQKNPKKKEKY